MLALIAIILYMLGHKMCNMAENTGKNASRVDNWFHARRPKHQSTLIYIPATV